ncbi:hypothetical protein FF011L_43730 [Roseimaritima multifibrata]|uniref:Flagellar protein FlgJ N-terminal domain-containing protein n=1 Tax=Roseimaritima multifibrata TaxID=1930274 RepID=A0A517ML01_9BACT|nr:rod-binding protein [Roseimaritima multifibrata]QDS95575.1 hypothetical protein FF011L_43730 [Roseimaritima multifibrata]
MDLSSNPLVGQRYSATAMSQTNSASNLLAKQESLGAPGVGGLAADNAPSGSGLSVDGEETSEMKDAFRQFVGETMFGQMLASMRETVTKPAYFHGGQTEEIFQKQLDQVLVEEMTEASADQIADPMYDLFTLRRG